MKRIIITALLALFCISNMQAGKNRGKVVTPKPSPNVAIGGGTSMPSNNARDKAFLSNSTAISIDASIPITKRGWGPNGNWFGVNIGGAYNFGGKGGFGTSPNPYAITGQTSSMVADRGKDPADPGFRMGAGPQANFHFGKFMVSPMLLGEYFSMTRKEMSSVQTTQYNGQSYDFTLATLPQTKTSGFAVTPKLRLQYMFNNRFGLFADASYTTGPKVETQITKLIPNGAANQQGTYEIQALQNGTFVKGETKKTSYNATGFNFGVVIGLGGNGNKGRYGFKEAQKIIDRKHLPRTADLHKAAGDIKKGWNGTIKELFEGNYADVMVSKNGGVENLISQINKNGKSTARKITKNGKEYLALSTKNGDNYLNELFPIENNGKAKIIGGNGAGCTGNCMSCTPKNGPTHDQCSCDETVQPNEFCSSSSLVSSLSHHLNLLDTSLIPITLVDKDHLSATSIKDIKKFIQINKPNSKITSVELLKQDNVSAIAVKLIDDNIQKVLYCKVPKTSSSFIHIPLWWYESYCAGNCIGINENNTSGNSHSNGKLRDLPSCGELFPGSSGEHFEPARCPCNIPGACVISVRIISLLKVE